MPNKNAFFEKLSDQRLWMDGGMGLKSLGGVKRRAAYGASKQKTICRAMEGNKKQEISRWNEIRIKKSHNSVTCEFE